MCRRASWGTWEKWEAAQRVHGNALNLSGAPRHSQELQDTTRSSPTVRGTIRHLLRLPHASNMREPIKLIYLYRDKNPPQGWICKSQYFKYTISTKINIPTFAYIAPSIPTFLMPISCLVSIGTSPPSKMVSKKVSPSETAASYKENIT